jgi:hypothetical protein
MAVAGMRGLNIFIQDVRNAANKEVEQARVEKELANIRTKFKNSKTMTAYDKKKCVRVESGWRISFLTATCVVVGFCRVVSALHCLHQRGR